MTTALFAEFTALEGCQGSVASLVADLAALVLAEPGTVVFAPYTLRSDPRRWFVYEVYRDDAAFQAHIATDHSVRFNADLAPLVEGGGSRLTWLQAPVP